MQKFENKNTFPNKIDTIIYNKLSEKNEKKKIPIFAYLKKISAVIIFFFAFASGWFLNNKQKVKFVETIKINVDTFYVENKIIIKDTLKLKQIVYKEKIVKVYIEKVEQKADNISYNHFNYDSIPLLNSESAEIVENINFEDLNELSDFFTEF